MSNSRIAIIPARGGSKRIPRKNLKPFLGTPIIGYSIQIALESDLFEEVIVSTDDEEIAAMAVEFGASVPFYRSKETSDDHATLADVVNEVEQNLKAANRDYDLGCLILATAPLITLENLNKGLDLLNSTQFGSTRPMVRFSYPIQRAFSIQDSGYVEMINKEHLRTRSQDLSPAYYDAGQFYWFRKHQFSDSNKGAFEISEIGAQDIDTPEDWLLAELKYKLMQESK